MARRRKKGFGWKAQIFLILGLLMAVLFSAISLIAVIGMIPTIVCAIADRTEKHLRTITVGSINFAGCAPFIIEVFAKGNHLDTAIAMIVQPRTIVVMYAAAGLGYLIDWALTGIVSAIMVQRARGRIREIQSVQEELAKRWGQEVNGTMPLDEYGFPRDSFAAKSPQD